MRRRGSSSGYASVVFLSFEGCGSASASDATVAPPGIWGIGVAGVASTGKMRSAGNESSATAVSRTPASVEHDLPPALLMQKPGAHIAAPGGADERRVGKKCVGQLRHWWGA